MTPGVLCEPGEASWRYLVLDAAEEWRVVTLSPDVARPLGTRPTPAALLEERADGEVQTLPLETLEALVLEPGTLALYAREVSGHFGLGPAEVEPLSEALAPRLEAFQREEGPFPRTALHCLGLIEVGVVALLALALYGVAAQGGDPTQVSGRRAGAKALLLLVANVLGPVGALILGGLAVAAAAIHSARRYRHPSRSIRFTRPPTPPDQVLVDEGEPLHTADREAAKIRGRMRDRLRGMEQGRAEARLEEGLPAQRPEPAAAGRTLQERISADLAERPSRGVFVLVLLPLMWPILLASSRGELRHESWRFRYHDFMVRQPALGLGLSLIGALGAVGAALAFVYVLVAARRYFPWVLW